MKNIIIFIVLFIGFKTLSAQSKKATKQFKQGVKDMETRKYVGAVVHFTEAISLFPKYEQALLQRGLCFYNMGEYNSAIKDFKQCIALDQQDLLPYINGIEAAHRAKSYDDGLFFAEHLGNNIPDNLGVAHYQKARFYEAKGDISEAILQYKMVVSLSDKNQDELKKLSSERLKALE